MLGGWRRSMRCREGGEDGEGGEGGEPVKSSTVYGLALSVLSVFSA